MKNILNSYACRDVVILKNSGQGGGLIGYSTGGGSVNYSYSAGIVSRPTGTGIAGVGGFVGSDKEGTGNYYNFSFWDSEIVGGFYNDTGDGGNYSGIYANTTAQMKKSSTYTGWDFTNLWRVDEDYSYPYLKWQSGPVCGIVAHPIAPDTSSGSGTPIEITLLATGFNVNPKKILVVLNKPESKTECFTVTSTGTLSVTASLNVLEEIIPFTTLTNSILQVPVGNSKTACAIFSADEFDVPENYTGKIEVSGSHQKKYIDVFLEIREKINITTNETIGILPVGVIFSPSSNIPIGILPVGVIFSPSSSIGILPVGVIFSPSSSIGILPVEYTNPNQVMAKKIAEPLVKGIGIISLWILLLLIFIAYFTIKKFIKLQDQLSGYKSKEEKLAMVERLKRNSLRKDSNFFEKIIDKGTIYLSEKALDKNVEQKKTKSFQSSVDDTERKSITETPYLKKVEPSPMDDPAGPSAEPKLISRSLPAYVTERYNRGSAFYSRKDYDNALKEFQKAVEIDKKFWQGYQGIGSCYLAKGKIMEAKFAFKESLLINPNNAKLIEWMKKNKI